MKWKTLQIQATYRCSQNIPRNIPKDATMYVPVYLKFQFAFPPHYSGSAVLYSVPVNSTARVMLLGNPKTKMLNSGSTPTPAGVSGYNFHICLKRFTKGESDWEAAMGYQIPMQDSDLKSQNWNLEGTLKTKPTNKNTSLYWCKVLEVLPIPCYKQYFNYTGYFVAKKIILENSIFMNSNFSTGCIITLCWHGKFATFTLNTEAETSKFKNQSILLVYIRTLCIWVLCWPSYQV